MAGKKDLRKVIKDIPVVLRAFTAVVERRMATGDGAGVTWGDGGRDHIRPMQAVVDTVLIVIIV